MNAPISVTKSPSNEGQHKESKFVTDTAALVYTMPWSPTASLSNIPRLSQYPSPFKSPSPFKPRNQRMDGFLSSIILPQRTTRRKELASLRPTLSIPHCPSSLIQPINRASIPHPTILPVIQSFINSTCHSLTPTYHLTTSPTDS